MSLQCDPSSFCFCFALPLYGNRQANPPPRYHFTLSDLQHFCLPWPCHSLRLEEQVPTLLGPQREDVGMPHRAAQGSSTQSPWLSTGPGPVGMQLQPSLSARGKKREDVGVELPPLPLVFARVPGGRPGQPNSAAGRCQNFTEQNCTSLFH